MTRRFFDRFTDRPDRNVGQSDFVTRIIASVLLAGLLAVLFPGTGFTYPIVKVSLLAVAELGLISLMLGLFLGAKTYFAGLQLFITPLLMFRLMSSELTWAALALGAVVLMIGVINLFTRRSRLNQVLNLSSLREVIEVVVPEVRPPPPDAGARS